jgi:copper chaperone
METAVLKVSGMTCSGCVASVKRVLEATPGVASASVSLEQGLATVSFDSAKTDPEKLGAAVRDAGYEVA